MSTFNNRVRALSKKRQLELIALWDYVDNVEHCIDLTTGKIHLATVEERDSHSNYESIENVDGGLDYVYYPEKSH